MEIDNDTPSGVESPIDSHKEQTQNVGKQDGFYFTSGPVYAGTKHIVPPVDGNPKAPKSPRTLMVAEPEQDPTNLIGVVNYPGPQFEPRRSRRTRRTPGRYS